MIQFKADITFAPSFELSVWARLRGKALGLLSKAEQYLAVRKIRALLSRHGTGRIYRSKTGSGTHQASSPGSPPASDTGAYADSWKTIFVETPTGGYVAIGSTLWDTFGRRLELGGSAKGKSGSYIAPRPHVRVLYANAEAEIDRDLAQLRGGS